MVPPLVWGSLCGGMSRIMSMSMCRSRSRSMDTGVYE